VWVDEHGTIDDAGASRTRRDKPGQQAIRPVATGLGRGLLGIAIGGLGVLIVIVLAAVVIKLTAAHPRVWVKATPESVKYTVTVKPLNRMFEGGGDKAIELDPRSTLAKSDLIEAVGGPDQFIQRITDLGDRVKTSNAPGLQLLLAYIYHQMDRPEEARTAVRAAKQGLPSSTSVDLLQAAIEGVAPG
jgi:hypothetical protein